MATVPYQDIKSIAFVRDFDQPGSERSVFQTRPKMEGLWVRLRFRDGDVLEGVMPNNLLQAGALRVFGGATGFVQQPTEGVRAAGVAAGDGGPRGGGKPSQAEKTEAREQGEYSNERGNAPTRKNRLTVYWNLTRTSLFGGFMKFRNWAVAAAGTAFLAVSAFRADHDY